jgi:ABC-type microcin C transport system permease subunit YejE
MSDEQRSTDFVRQAASSARPSLASELLAFMRDNKKWWLGPILVVILLVALLAITGGQAAAPFIYTLF